jgi:hypothetical protein
MLPSTSESSWLTTAKAPMAVELVSPVEAESGPAPYPRAVLALPVTLS